MKKIFVILVLLSFIAACGGRAAHPVAIQQYGDAQKTCDALQVEMASIQSQITELLPQTDKTANRVGWGVAGLFIWPLWFAMDLSDAEKHEVEALRQRYNYLLSISQTKKCGLENVSVQQ
jgi:hypothetical protein